jgi:hypothetical protein
LVYSPVNHSLTFEIDHFAVRRAVNLRIARIVNKGLRLSKLKGVIDGQWVNLCLLDQAWRVRSGAGCRKGQHHEREWVVLHGFGAK